MKTTAILLSRLRLITPSADDNKCPILHEIVTALWTYSHKDGFSPLLECQQRGCSTRYERMTKSGCHSTKFPCLDGKQNSRGREDGRR